MNYKHILIGLKVSIWAIALFGLNGTMSLVKDEFTKGNICPTIIGIPACYIILSCLLLILVSHTNFFKDKCRLFFIGAGISATIAIIGTAGQLMGWIECPRTEGGTPMCFLSLALFSSLLILKWMERKVSH